MTIMSVDTELRKARRFIKNDNHKKAQEICEKILKKFPKNKRTFETLNQLKMGELDKNFDEINFQISSGNLLEADKLADEFMLLHPYEIKLLKISGTIKANLKNYVEANNIFTKLSKLEDNPYETYANLGNVYYLQKNYKDAENYFKKSINLNPNFDVPYNGLALLSVAKKEFDLGIENFKIALKHNPSSKHTLSNLGNCYKEMEMYELALEYYEKALEIDENFPEAHNNIGFIMRFQNKLMMAIEHFTRAIKLCPDYIDAYYNRGATFHDIKEYHKGILDFQKVIAMNPNYGKAYISLGNVYFSMQNFKNAIENYLRGIQILPDQYEALNNLGVCYTSLRQYKQSIKYFDESINAKLDYSLAYNNKGNALNMLCRFEEAFMCLDLAKSLDNKNSEIPLNLGNLMFIQSQYAEAIKHYEHAINLNPNYADAYFNLSLIKLLFCDFQNGLNFYEWRLSPDRKNPIYNNKIEKMWDGKVSLKNKILVVLSEQGLGDTIQFCRFVKLLNPSANEVIFKVQDCLVELISSFDKSIRVVSNREKIENFDFQIPLMSLPSIFKMTYKTIPSEDKYLYANYSLIKKWKLKLGSKGFKIGVSWKGSNSDADRFRSFSLKEFEVLSSLKGVRFISLQKYDGEILLDNNSNIKIEDYTNEIDNGDQAFSDTAAIIENLDLVITCDTSIGHLAGSLNCPTWIVLASSHDWRWFLNNENSAWYPSVSLFRQKDLLDWTLPFQSIKNKLSNILKSYN